MRHCARVDSGFKALFHVGGQIIHTTIRVPDAEVPDPSEGFSLADHANGCDDARVRGELPVGR